MSSKNRKPKRPSRLPAIVPRFLKSAVTVGAIPALVNCGSSHPRMQPVVAQMMKEPAPVVAAYAPDRPVDAGIDAAPTPVQAPVVAAVVPPPPPPPVVAAMGPPVVAAMVPHPPPPPPKKKSTKLTKP